MSKIRQQLEARYLIVNADDFGLSEGINTAIIQAHEYGILTSATIMANMPAAEEAVKMSRENPGLGIGVHLNFIRGNPLSKSDEIKSLLNEEGRFVQKAKTFIKRIFQRKINPKELEVELSAQVQKVINLGITPTHFDSEKNLHLLPVVQDVVIRVAKNFGVKAIRFTDEATLSHFVGVKNAWLDKKSFKMRFLSFNARRACHKLEKAELKFPNYFWGVVQS